MTFTKSIHLILVVAVVSSGFPAFAQQEKTDISVAFTEAQKLSNLPKVKSTDGSSCDTAFKFAQDAFSSNSVNASDYAVENPDIDKNNVVLSPKNLGWEGFNTDQTVKSGSFPDNKRLRAYYAVKGKNDKNYTVALHLPGNWHGDRFSVYSVDNLDQISKIVDKGKPKYQMGDGSMLSNLSTFIEDDWKAPTLLMDKTLGKILYVETGDSYFYNHQWKVYAQDEKGKPSLTCTIAFSDKTNVFPTKNIKRFAKLLHNIIGTPKDMMSEGSLHPNANAHARLDLGWFNVVLRPWALQPPYDTRERVESGLKEWSKGSKSYRAEYRQLKTLYPLVERDLSRYYQKAFSLDKDASKALATKATDEILRLGFSFPS